MAVGVIDGFEVVHVHHQRTQRLLLAQALRVEQLGLFVKRPTVHQPGQLIGLGGAGGNVMSALHLPRQAKGFFQGIGELARRTRHKRGKHQHCQRHADLHR